MEEFNFLRALGVFMSMFAVDVLLAFYIRRTGQGRALAAAIFGSVIAFLGAFVVKSYVGNAWYVVPMFLGSFVGTYVTVWRDSKRKVGLPDIDPPCC